MTSAFICHRPRFVRQSRRASGKNPSCSELSLICRERERKRARTVCRFSNSRRQCALKYGHGRPREGERSRTYPLLCSIASGRINDLARKIEIIPTAKPRHLYSPDLTEERSPFFADRVHCIIPDIPDCAHKWNANNCKKFYSYVKLEKGNRNGNVLCKVGIKIDWSLLKNKMDIDKISKLPLMPLKLFKFRWLINSLSAFLFQN